MQKVIKENNINDTFMYGEWYKLMLLQLFKLPQCCLQGYLPTCCMVMIALL